MIVCFDCLCDAPLQPLTVQWRCGFVTLGDEFERNWPAIMVSAAPSRNGTATYAEMLLVMETIKISNLMPPIRRTGFLSASDSRHPGEQDAICECVLAMGSGLVQICLHPTDSELTAEGSLSQLRRSVQGWLCRWAWKWWVVSGF